MRKISISLFVFFLALAQVQAQKVVYDDNAQKREVGSFHGIESSSGIEVIMSKGDKEELAVSVGNTAYLNEVRTEVEGGILKIYRSSNWKLWNNWKNFKVKVYVSFKTMNSVKATSGSLINATDISADLLTARMNSGGIITLSGKAEMLDVDGNSGGQFRGYNLQANKCSADVSSGAGIQVTVNKEISARANSGGFVRFKGDGLIRDINVNSGGSVKRQS